MLYYDYNLFYKVIMVIILNGECWKGIYSFEYKIFRFICIKVWYGRKSGNWNY